MSMPSMVTANPQPGSLHSSSQAKQQTQADTQEGLGRTHTSHQILTARARHQHYKEQLMGHSK